MVNQAMVTTFCVLFFCFSFELFPVLVVYFLVVEVRLVFCVVFSFDRFPVLVV